ncbi:hypothetical protein COY13_03310 [Candidatus Roizmanbacteria bacterium CG_4_10_14_0_2_um_filter_36_35]|uniref:Secreted protein n=3 Tax=Candidatus Roizmaniibacteriota TaxID=1752723 RepID=A0A2M7BXH6_9BACT|nr:MAG: hypothetical protein COV86_01295 [Candidatus Roizmanbacteria bacterium CG11_big_fil_rev_8_21_14_0_20_35_14]PIV11249.1 MAG: hypothetical protein COS50_00955 [Candidatus Roizmanbacteria bacterium CG03_land_8_20_14_0_80_35_26]PIZ67438.1 MAG: hypothetical protein COY13_03310 [Candidatus Roizmanbacteria bacterium CG_4_10_14_0_2_um_filter_36_35]
MRKLFFLLILTVPLIFSNSVFAHPGRTAADGCHYCRTNCDSWGVPWNERHCHNGGTVQGIQESAPVYNPPINTPIPWPTWTPIPTKTPIPTITLSPTAMLTPQLTKIVSRTKKIQKSVIKKRTFWQWLFGN